MTCMYSFTSYSFISFYAKEMFVDSCRKRRKVCIEEHDYFVFTSVQYIFRIKLFDSSFNKFVLFLLLSFFYPPPYLKCLLLKISIILEYLLRIPSQNDNFIQTFKNTWEIYLSLQMNMTKDTKK